MPRLWDCRAFQQLASSDLTQALASVASHNRELIKNWRVPTSHKMYPRQRELHRGWGFCAAPSNGEPARISVTDQTTDQAICQWPGHRVCALNFANAYHPGGGYLHGDTAQEEELCRQYPQLYASLDELSRSGGYPIRPHEAVLTERVGRLREDRSRGYEVIQGPVTVASFVTSAAPDLRGVSEWQTREVRQHLGHAIQAIFHAANSWLGFRQSPAVLVLGAWGCGAFAPSAATELYKRTVAGMFSQACQLWGRQFDRIVFAIPVRPGCDNHEIFRQELS